MSRVARALACVSCLLVCVSLVSACKMDKVPATPEAPPPPPHSEAPSPTQPGMYGQPAVGSPESPSADVESGGRKSTHRRDMLQRPSSTFDELVEDFAVAESAFLQTTGACTDACRALRSMMRAADRMCVMAATDSERERCGTARQRVRSAVELVRSACRTCNGNPVLDGE